MPPPTSHTQHHHHFHAHTHVHGAIDPSILASQRGIWALKWSFVGLLATAGIQAIVVVMSGSVALLADTIHNVADALTAIPLWIAFLLARLKPTKRFTYGYGRVEDIAGVVIVLTILASAVSTGYVSIDRIFHPQPIEHLGIVAMAAVIGFIGNEAIAFLRIHVGREIGSAALVADGHHAHVDALTSLAVLVSAAGVWAGYPLADPVIGILVVMAILKIAWNSGTLVFTRLLDGIEPEVVDDIAHAVSHIPAVVDLTDVKVRWIGHRMHAELNITVEQAISVEDGHNIAKEVHHWLLHHLRYLATTTIHVDPADSSGITHHHIPEHEHDSLPTHSHRSE